MRERVVRFGDPAELVGVLTEPETSAVPGDPGDLPGVVLLNSGILHRVGASRLYVQMARGLAQAGFTTLRFDFSGIGDSQVRRDDLSFEESAAAETRAAMDYLSEAAGSESFVLGGLCSGADTAFRVAVDDRRVTGLAQLDGWPYRSWQSVVKHYGDRILDPGQWVHSIRVRLEALGERLASDGAEDSDAPEYLAPEYRRQFPPKSDVEKGLHELVGRGVQLYYFFSGNYGKDYNYEGQYRDAFSSVGFGDLLTVDYVPEASHIVAGLEHQEFVVRAVRDWAERAWADAGRGEDAGARGEDTERRRTVEGVA